MLTIYNVKYISYFTVTVLLIISRCNQSPKRTLNLESYLPVMYSLFIMYIQLFIGIHLQDFHFFLEMQ